MGNVQVCRFNQRLGIRMLRRAEYGFFGALLNHLSLAHHQEVLRQIMDDTQIVRYENVGQAAILLQVEQQVHDLTLDGHVER